MHRRRADASPTATRARPIRRRRATRCARSTAPRHSVDSNAVPVLVDSTAVSAPQRLTATTPTAAAPVLTWPAPAVVHRRPLRHLPRRAAARLDDRRRRRRTRTRPRPRARTTTPCSPATPPPSRACSRPRSRCLSTSTAPTSGGAPTAQVLRERQRPARLAGRGRRALGRRRLRRAPRRRRRAAGRRRRRQRRCARRPRPAASDAVAAAGTWSYGVFARDGAGNVALIGTVANVVDRRQDARRSRRPS